MDDARKLVSFVETDQFSTVADISFAINVRGRPHHLLSPAIITWIERTYRRRRHAVLGRLTPIEYETIMTHGPSRPPKPSCRPKVQQSPALGRAVAFGDHELVGQPAGRLTCRRAPRFSWGCHVKIALPLVTLSVGIRQVTCPEGREGMAVMASCGRRTGGSGSRCVALHAVSSESCQGDERRR